MRHRDRNCVILTSGHDRIQTRGRLNSARRSSVSKFVDMIRRKLRLNRSMILDPTDRDDSCARARARIREGKILLAKPGSALRLAKEATGAGTQVRTECGPIHSRNPILL